MTSREERRPIFSACGENGAARVLVCPLPPTTAACRVLSLRLDAQLAPWLSAAQAAHVRAFRRERDGCARRLARVALAAGLAARGERPEVLLPRLRHLPGGAPCLPGWAVAFSYSEEAAFAALMPAGEAQPRFGMDAEACASAPPSVRAFSVREQRPDGGLSARERLRRWVIKESLLKAVGTGLTRDPAEADSGRHGQRHGVTAWDGTLLCWRCFPLPGHWLALAAARPLRVTIAICPPEHLLS